MLSESQVEMFGAAMQLWLWGDPDELDARVREILEGEVPPSLPEGESEPAVEPG